MTYTSRVFIVEDDTAIRQMLFEVVRGEGYAVETFADGRGVLERLRRSAERIALLLDLNMPFVTGMDILFAAGADSTLAARHHFIVMTASRAQHLFSDVAVLRRLRYTWLAKPFRVADVIDIVDHVAAELRAADLCDQPVPECAP